MSLDLTDGMQSFKSNYMYTVYVTMEKVLLSPPV